MCVYVSLFVVGQTGEGSSRHGTHLDLEKVLGRAVDLVKGLLAGIGQTGHGLHDRFCEAGDRPLWGGCWARRGWRDGRRLVRRCRSAIGARGVVTVRSRFDGIARVLWVVYVYQPAVCRLGDAGLACSVAVWVKCERRSG